MASNTKNSLKQKANTMTVAPGMRFVAITDCYIGKCLKAGDPVVFSPGQEAPLNLVRLVDEAPEPADAGSLGGEEETSQPEGEEALVENSSEASANTNGGATSTEFTA